MFCLPKTAWPPTSKGEKTDWKNVAEVRMLMYVIPVGIAIALLSLLLSNL